MFVKIGAVDFKNFVILAVTQFVNGFGQTVFAGTDFPFDQYGHGVFGEALNGVAQFDHHFAFADGEKLFRQFLFEVMVFMVQGQMLHGAFGGDDQFRQRQWFFQKIIGTELGGFNRGFNGAVSGHHDHATVIQNLFVQHSFQQSNAVNIRHPDVEKDNVGIGFSPDGLSLLPISGGIDLTTLF